MRILPLEHASESEWCVDEPPLARGVSSSAPLECLPAFTDTGAQDSRIVHYVSRQCLVLGGGTLADSAVRWTGMDTL